MKIQMVRVLAVLTWLNFALHINAISSGIAMQTVNNAYRNVFETNKIKNILKSVIVGVERDNVVNQWNGEAWITLDSFVKANAQGDQDLIGPWTIITRENNIIMNILIEWQAIFIKMHTVGQKPAGSVVKQSVSFLENALKAVQDAYNKLNKTFFIRANKKEAVTCIKRFAELLMSVGKEVSNELQNASKQLSR